MGVTSLLHICACLLASGADWLRFLCFSLSLLSIDYVSFINRQRNDWAQNIVLSLLPQELINRASPSLLQHRKFNGPWTCIKLSLLKESIWWGRLSVNISHFPCATICFEGCPIKWLALNLSVKNARYKLSFKYPMRRCLNFTLRIALFWKSPMTAVAQFTKPSHE
jgi:hypothetical protein